MSNELVRLRGEVKEYKALLAQAEEDLNERTRSAEPSTRAVAFLEQKAQEAMELAGGHMDDALLADRPSPLPRAGSHPLADQDDGRRSGLSR